MSKKYEKTVFYPYDARALAVEYLKRNDKELTPEEYISEILKLEETYKIRLETMSDNSFDILLALKGEEDVKAY
ncbi:MAG TPA: hypothetical protein ACHBY4_14195 [Arsenophonus apicola]|uniref:hypothetical protein n=1 Tax=Arsenophonus apicola TaxID=2879119 RepID=UPI0038795E2A